MNTITGYKVVIMSDLHLGMKDSSPKKILEFLNSIETELLILNGDIIDIDALKRGSKWKNKHTKVLMKILDISRHTEVIYIRGNHDNDLEDLFEFDLGNIKFVEDYIPSIKKINGVTYYNSGDWVENFSALVLTKENKWELITLS